MEHKNTREFPFLQDLLNGLGPESSVMTRHLVCCLKCELSSLYYKYCNTWFGNKSEPGHGQKQYVESTINSSQQFPVYTEQSSIALMKLGGFSEFKNKACSKSKQHLVRMSIFVRVFSKRPKNVPKMHL